MDSELTQKLAALIGARATAALGTLHDGVPFVSMVPYAVAGDGSGLLIHVSGLAAHTRDMLAEPRVSVLIAEPEGAGISPLALPRVSIQGEARPVAREAAGYEDYKSVYTGRFPDSEPMFGFGDFSLFMIHPKGARFVAGFGKAHSLSGDTLKQILRQR